MIEFTQDRLERFKAIVAKYEQKSSALLPTMYLAQEQFGYLSNEVMMYIAKLLDMPPVRVFEAATFYVLFRKKDMGKYCLQVCNNITCTLMGSPELMKVIHEELGIKHDEVDKSKEFSLMSVQCLGSCDTAPVVQVNETYFEKMTPEKLREVIRKLRSGIKEMELVHEVSP